ncbi:MAG: hypothetical protein PHT69_10495 [Bacteroidales bacterium]|nr:hypothetical protein [Bacteroidales bacterium]
MRLSIKRILIYLLLFTAFSAYSQLHNYQRFTLPETKSLSPAADDDLILQNLGLQVGISVGLYLPDNQTANYYNSTKDNRLYHVIMDYPYNYQALREYYNYEVHLDSNYLPRNMKFTPALNLTFAVNYFFNPNNIFIFDFSYAKLTSNDAFFLVIEDLSNLTTEPVLAMGKIWGKEERMNINIGYGRSFGKPKRIKPFWEIGFNINDTRVLENKASIAGFTYDIRDPYNQYYGLKEGGIGMGFFASQCVLFNVSEAFSMHLGVNFSMKTVGLIEEGMPMNKEWSFFLRIMYKNLFGGSSLS